MKDLAKTFAQIHHGFQVRKYTGEPYWHHLRNVAQIVQSVPHTTEMVCAAWLHDTIEDTHVTYEMVKETFGPEIADMVRDLTDVYTSKAFPHMNRKARKAAETARLALVSPAVQTVKLADLIDNSASILKHDPDFAKVYLEEKRALLAVLTQGDVTLMAWAKSVTEVT